jgi:hypothetical protein
MESNLWMMFGKVVRMLLHVVWLGALGAVFFQPVVVPAFASKALVRDEVYRAHHIADRFGVSFHTRPIDFGEGRKVSSFKYFPVVNIFTEYGYLSDGNPVGVCNFDAYIVDFSNGFLLPCGKVECRPATPHVAGFDFTGDLVAIQQGENKVHEPCWGLPEVSYGELQFEGPIFRDLSFYVGNADVGASLRFSNFSGHDHCSSGENGCGESSTKGKQTYSDASYAKPKGWLGPGSGLVGGIRSLPLGAKIGITIVATWLAGVCQVIWFLLVISQPKRWWRDLYLFPLGLALLLGPGFMWFPG